MRGPRLLGAKGHGSAVGCGLLAQAGCIEGLCPHRGNDSLHFVRRSAPSKCVRCASLSLRERQRLHRRGEWIALRAMLIKSALRDLLFYIIRYDRNSADWLAALATPYPGCAGLLHGKACHTILRSLRFLTNRVPLPPLFRGQNNLCLK